MTLTVRTFLLLVFAWAGLSISDTALARDNRHEHIVLSGGPSLRQWENYRVEAARHDRWWGNFIRTARIRMEQIREEYGPEARITWLVYRRGYERRAAEDGEPLISHIRSVQEKIGCKLVWYNSADEVIQYLNHGMNRSVHKIQTFDYFGHSNKYCFTLDYSGDILGASRVFIHEDHLSRIRRGIFARGAECQSWGCHTGESMSAKWRAATGAALKGAVGKTDYSESWKNVLPHISTPGGRWVR